jgi:CO dehydrogenase/acetyl-CoA synthase delta subunit
MTAPPARRHRLATPRRVRVRAAEHDGRPLVVDGRSVDAVRESWLVEDRWWTDRPVRRRYWEVVTTCGRNVVVFHDLRAGGWFAQR